jgi:hypothetical protein
MTDFGPIRWRIIELLLKRPRTVSQLMTALYLHDADRPARSAIKAHVRLANRILAAKGWRIIGEHGGYRPARGTIETTYRISTAPALSPAWHAMWAQPFDRPELL